MCFCRHGTKVKSMIKLIEVDAGSFARRCTTRNAPKLMKLVEEFYRTYRAFAERYDFATNELYHAQETLQAAFPDQELFEDFESSNQALYFWILRNELCKYPSLQTSSLAVIRNQ
ncbi:putative protein Networked (NET), actin-binding (NAB) [Helianthus anomalus]